MVEVAPRYGTVCNMTRLPSVLSVVDLPIAELCAARMDGELVGIDECFVPLDQPIGMIERADALRAVAGPRAVAHGSSALWIYGLLETPPTVHTVWVSRANRSAVKRTRRVLVRETHFLDGDLARLGSSMCVSPVRIVFDLVCSVQFADAEAAILSRIVSGLDLDSNVCLARICAVPNLPGARVARARFRAVMA